MNLSTTSYIKPLFSLGFVLWGLVSFAQTPEGINYQAVIRNTSGALVTNANMAIRIQIKQNSATGTVVYAERQSVISSQYGLVNFVIGQGTVLSGTFANINWSTGNYWVSLGVDFSNGTNYIDYGSQRLMSVPYAMYAKTAGAQLNQWRYGSGVPAGTLGVFGDFYLNTTNGNVYYKSNATTWVLTGSIMGPAGATGAQGIQGVAGVNGLNALVKTTVEPAGINCATGGTKVETGIDANNNGILEAGEVNAAQTTYVCNGATGTAGVQGPQGPAGPTGPQGAQGPAGSLANGSAAGNTPYWNGTQWVVNTSNIFNNGGSVGIGTASPNASAALDVNSTSKGLLLPTMTQTQRNGISNPATGLLIFQTDNTPGFYYFNGTTWAAFGVAGGGGGSSGYNATSNTLIYTTDGF